MKWKGRPQSKNLNDQRDTTFTGRRNKFINESLKIGADNNKPTTSGFGRQGSRPKPTGRKTGGGF